MSPSSSTIGERSHWRDKLRSPITNRIAKASSPGRLRNVTNEGADEVPITLADCIAIDSTRYKAYAWGGEKVETPNKEPQTMACFISSAKQNGLLRPCCMVRNTSESGGRR